MSNEQRALPATDDKSTVEIGKEAEDRAARFLLERGYAIVERNFRAKLGELDIIAKDGECLVFVEVRSRADNRHGDPLETVGRRKQLQIARVAELYLIARRLLFDGVRFDVIAITGDAVAHYVDAFRLGLLR